jgi:hypothetical protein
LDLSKSGDLATDSPKPGAKLFDASLALLIMPAPLLLGVLTYGVPDFRFGKCLLCRPSFTIELGLGCVLALQLLGDRGTPSSQLLHH